ncbi:MAG: glycosyltransferase [Longimicrobiales bacterium]|nr:glycosyltransferase [Longimicrobiales bacterium]
MSTGKRGGPRPGGARRGTAVVVAYYAPPALGIASNRLVGLLRYLPELGWDPVLVAPASVHHHRASGEGEPLAAVSVVRVPNPEPSRWLRALAGGLRPGGGGEASREPGTVEELRPVPTGVLRSWARRLVNEWLYVPDAQALWIPAAGRAAAQALREAEGRPRVVFSTSVPFSCHFAARRAARETGVPWVAEYRDPWSVAPPQFGRRSALRRAVDRRLDHGLAVAARHLVVTSEQTRSLFLKAFPELTAAEVTVIRNGWEEVAPATDSAPPGPGEPLGLAYAGSLLRPEWATPFLAALERILEDAPGALVLDVYGPEEPWLALARGRPGGAAHVRLHGMLPAAEAAAALRRASVLVLLQPDAVNYVPGKAYDYLGARRPVVADVPAGSETHGLLAEYGEVHSLHDLDTDGIASVLRGMLERHRRGLLAEPTVAQDTVDVLSRRAQMARLARVFDGVVEP